MCRDLRQGIGQQGALQGFGDGMLAGEGVGVGQPRRQPTAKLLGHRDVGLGESWTSGAAAEDDNTERAMGAQQRGGDRAARAHELHHADRIRLGTSPGSHLGGDVA